MKILLALAGLLVSFNLMAADIYEFRGDWDSAPAKTQQPKKSPPPRQATTEQAVTPRQEPATPASKTTREDSVVHVNDCASGAQCNDL